MSTTPLLDSINRNSVKTIWSRSLNIGMLPFLLVMSITYFSLASSRFLTIGNFINITQQSVYLLIISLGQFFVLLTGGFDLAVGTTVALSSVFSALTMSHYAAVGSLSSDIVIAIGCFVGIATGALMGVVNGLGVAMLRVSPFIMTLGTASIGLGMALFATSGVPVAGMPDAFGMVFGYGRWFGIPGAVVIGVVLTILVFVATDWTKFGRYLYAVGGNAKAARLSGVNVPGMLFLAYLLAAILAAISGVLLTARLGTGEANIGTSYPMESIAACVIAGVSLKGGHGKALNVVLGVLFIGTIQNGMSIARVDSYLQIVILGVILILAVVIDQLRMRLLGVEAN